MVQTSGKLSAGRPGKGEGAGGDGRLTGEYQGGSNYETLYREAGQLAKKEFEGSGREDEKPLFLCVAGGKQTRMGTA